MGFVILMSFFVIGLLIGSLTFSYARVILFFIPVLLISMYLFILNPDQQFYMDDKSTNMSFVDDNETDKQLNEKDENKKEVKKEIKKKKDK